uniref:Putative Shiga-like toxin beta subunit n=1 Tax=Bacteriophage APSE-5 TaxID=568991 RepID=B6SCY3_9VIRU|nr:putative Shiga-like toxin beta subunit [Bacteriophage APSE-5]
MLKLKLLTSLAVFTTLLFSCGASYALPSCSPGVIQYIRYEADNDKTLVIIKLNSINNENYTDNPRLLQPLTYAYAVGKNVILHTESCTSGDHGFSSFSLKNK